MPRMRTRRLVNPLPAGKGMSRRLIPLAILAVAAFCGHARADSLQWQGASHDGQSKVIYDSQVTAVSYSTGEQGSKLKWLPYRPSKSAGENDAVYTDDVQQTEFRDPPAPSLNAADDPLNNPFGDAQDDGQERPQPPRFKLARARGPNGRGPVLQPIAADKNTLPLPGLSKEENKKLFEAPPKLLLTEPADEGYGDNAKKRQVPSIEKELASNPQKFMDACPSSRESFKSIRELSDNITAKRGAFPRECDLSKEVYQPRAWTPTTFAWTAPGMCNKPLYFEQVQAERYGHSWGPVLQPLISGAHFFVTVPILPYKMGMYPPGECMYSLGYYRPGNCAPYMLDPLPISIRGGLIQAGTVVGAAYIIP